MGKVVHLDFGKEEELVKNRDMSLVHESVTDDEIARIVSRWTGIPVAKLNESERMKTLHLDDELQTRIKTILRTNASPRHVPARMIQVPDIPRTLNGKKVESAVTNIVNGRKVTNRDALENPDSLDFYYEILPDLQAN